MSATVCFGVLVAVVATWFTWREVAGVVVAGRVRRRLDRPSASPAPVHRVAAMLASLRARSNDGIDRGLASWLDASARAARSGASLRDALRDGASAIDGSPTGVFLQPMVQSLDRGDRLVVAIDRVSAGPPGSARELVDRSLRLAAAVGGPAAGVLDAAATTLHERAALVREVRALSTQARVSAAVMVAAPLVFAVVAAQVDGRVGAFLLSAPGGLCVVAGVALDAAGAWWMARIVRAAA